MSDINFDLTKLAKLAQQAYTWGNKRLDQLTEKLSWLNLLSALGILLTNDDTINKQRTPIFSSENFLITLDINKHTNNT